MHSKSDKCLPEKHHLILGESKVKVKYAPFKEGEF
jgi:hypothetical protein